MGVVSILRSLFGFMFGSTRCRDFVVGDLETILL